MSTSQLNKIAYQVYVDKYGLYFDNVKKGNKYCFMETDGTLTDLGACLVKECDSKICWHDGPSWWEELQFENTSELQYSFLRGGSGTSNSNRLPIIEKNE